jgi:hypothetical protein
LKGCGMEDMDDEQLAVEAWNSNQREKHD